MQKEEQNRLNFVPLFPNLNYAKTIKLKNNNYETVF